MNIINQNPFRVLGLLGNASEKELQRQIGIIKRYAEVGKSKSFDYDFEFIGQLRRDSNQVQKASNQIEQAHKKLLYSLFWFVSNTQFDEIAFNNLQGHDIEKASEIWNKTLKDEITSKNFSSYLNLSTLFIAISLTGDQINHDLLKKGIKLKGQLIFSDYLPELSSLVTGNGTSTNQLELSKKFIDESIVLLKPYLNRGHGVLTKDMISLFSSFPNESKKYVASKFISAPIANIENKIDKTSKLRRNNPRDAEEYGEALYIETKTDITFLKQILGGSNVQYQMMANKLASEILQCSIDFFNKLREEETEYDPGDDAIRILKYAKSIGAKGQTIDRINEAMESIQDWIDDAPNRKRQEAIAEDLAHITIELQEFQGYSNSIQNSRNLISECQPRLQRIRSVLGSQDDFYLQVSSAVVNNALGMLIEVVNNQQSRIQFDTTVLISLPTTISSALSVMERMEYLDMKSDVRARFDTNKKTIKGIKSQLDSITNSSSSYSSSSSSGGCYIATMAYGDYNHPKVMILRDFRDNVLDKSKFGRLFIKFYYCTSPSLVKLLKNQKFINLQIRKLLDKFIIKLQK